MAEECPLELALATLRAQVSSSASAGDGAFELPRRGRREGSAQQPSTSELYAEFRSLLPNLPSSPRMRVTKEQILDAAAAQVKVLEDTVAVLEAYRGVRARPRRRCPEVAVSGPTVCLSARLPAARPGVLRRELEVFHRWVVEVLAATVARHGGGGGTVADAVVTVTAAVAPPEVMEMIRVDISRIQ